MSRNKKISIIILGKDYCQKRLMCFITGKDISALSKTDHPKNFQIFENYMYVFTCAPDIKTGCEEIREIFSENPHPDMCLMVVEEGFSEQNVWDQIESLHDITGRGTGEFIVVLPQGHSPTSYPFISWTMEEVLRKLAEHRYLEQNSKSSDDRSEEKMSLQTDEEETGCRGRKENFTARKKRQKRKHPPSRVTLVLLGMSGTGKSATGNTILGEKHFVSKVSSMPVTKECQMAETAVCQSFAHVRMIDTPDIFDDDIKSTVRGKHVAKCKELCESGPCVFLLVMHVSRFTDGERDVLKKLEKAFGTNAKEQTVIIFTRGEDLLHAGMRFREFLETCERDLKKIVDQCGGRCVLFENNKTSSDQVAKLMEIVYSMLKQEKQ